MDDRLFKSLEWRCIGPHRGGRVWPSPATRPTPARSTSAAAPAASGRRPTAARTGRTSPTATSPRPRSARWPSPTPTRTSSTPGTGEATHSRQCLARRRRLQVRRRRPHLAQRRPGATRATSARSSSTRRTPTSSTSRRSATPGARTRSAASTARATAARPGSRCCYKSEQAGAADLTMDPHNPRVLYAAIWQAQRYPHALAAAARTPASGAVHRRRRHLDRTSPATRACRKGMLGKIGVAASPAQPGRVWALVEARRTAALLPLRRLRRDLGAR